MDNAVQGVKLILSAQLRAHQSAEGAPHVLWSFENVKTFVQAEVGLAIVPRLMPAKCGTT